MTRRATHVLVMAKAPVPGRVKTRLQPVTTAEGAAAIAAAAIHDTLNAVRGCRADRRVLALDGVPAPWMGEGFEVVAQSAGSFNDRLAAAWSIAGAPGVQIGMDTPQVTADVLNDALTTLLSPPVDAVLGFATDGGWWAIGFRQPVPAAFDGVTMSRDDTGEHQLARLRALGLRVALLPELTDMDLPADLRAICADHPLLETTRVAASLGALAAAARV